VLQLGVQRRQVCQRATDVNIQKSQGARKALGSKRLTQRLGLRCVGFWAVWLACEHHNGGRCEKRTQKMLIHETTY
jgi:hypothetical protein